MRLTKTTTELCLIAPNEFVRMGMAHVLRGSFDVRVFDTSEEFLASQCDAQLLLIVTEEYPHDDITAIRDALPDCRVVLLSRLWNPDHALLAIRSGLFGYIHLEGGGALQSPPS